MVGRSTHQPDEPDIKIAVFLSINDLTGRIHHTVPMKNRAENKKAPWKRAPFVLGVTNPYYSFSLLIRIP